jgi:hypothetical protein
MKPISGKVYAYYDTTTMVAPTWLTIKGAAGVQVQPITSSASDKEIFTIYPSSVNPQGQPTRTAQIAFTNTPLGDITYRDLTILTITQDHYPIVAPTPISASLIFDSSVANGLIINGTPVGNTTDQTTTLTYSMSVTRQGATGAQFQVNWRATINGSGLLGGNGSFMANDGGATVGSLVLASYPPIGASIIVYLSTPLLSTSAIGYADLLSEKVTIYDPIAIASYVAFDKPALSWTATEGGYGDFEEVTITCPPTSCYLYSIPSWITVWSDGGAVLGINDVIMNNGRIRIAPTVPNTGGVLPLSYVTLRNSFTNSDANSIVCNQSAASAPPGETAIVPTITVNSGDSYLTITACATQIMSASTSFTLYPCILRYALGTQGQTVTIYWKAYINGTAVQIGGGSFQVQNSLTAYINIPKTLTLTTAADSGDTIQIKLSVYNF